MMMTTTSKHVFRTLIAQACLTVAVLSGVALMVTTTSPVHAGSILAPPSALSGVGGTGTGISDAPAFRASLGAGDLCVGDDAGDAPYTPADGADWVNPDPTEAAGALDALASRLTDVETAGFQPLTAALTDWSDVGVVGTADLFPYSTAEGVWAYGTVTAAGRAILDDADAAAQRATLGITGGGGGAYDWASSAAPTVVSDWTDADDLGGTQSVCVEAIESSGVRVRTGYQADCSTAWTTTNRSVGVLRATVANDFVIAARVSWYRPALLPGAGTTAIAAVSAFVDGDDVLADSWYGGGLYLSSSGPTTSGVLSFESTAGVARWTGYSSFSTKWNAPSVAEVDIVWQRVGANLTTYWGPARGVGYPMSTVTVSTDPGLVGLRVETQIGTADELNFAIVAYRADLPGLPW